MSGSWSKHPPSLSRPPPLSCRGWGDPGFPFLPTVIVQLPLLRVWLNLLHNDVRIQHPQEDPNLADEHPLQPLCQLTDVNIQDDLYQVAFPGIWKAQGPIMAANC